MSGEIKISISQNLHQELQSYLKKTAFVSVDEFVEYILQSFFEQKKNTSMGGASDKEIEDIRKRLENLGYL